MRSRGHRFDGQKVWRTLHALGIQWGDLDQFQWCDPTKQTDYLFWAEVNDGELGYALPEEIAAGRQHFQSVRFYFNIPRTPHPAHVLHKWRVPRNASPCNWMVNSSAWSMQRAPRT